MTKHEQNPTVLVTGASRGLAARLCREYAEAGWRVIATARRPEHPDQLALDVGEEKSIAALARDLAGGPIDLLINNAAILGDTGGIASLRTAEFIEVMRVNTLGPLLVFRALLPNLLAGQRRLVANISSRVGTVAGLDEDGDYAYRCSKAALNLATAKLAYDYGDRGLTIVALHPGWVKTDMGGPDARLTVEESASKVKSVLDRVTAADGGKLLSYDGTRLA